jgi:hypothetical protein
VENQKPNHACIIMSGDDEREEEWGEVRKGDIQV